jgi:uncharacterized RDD family membrane protein YckC
MDQNFVYCSNCGSANPAGGSFCQKCGARLTTAGAAGSTAAPAVGYQTYAAAAPTVAVRYGGFWIRFLAVIIDAIIVRIAVTPIVAIVGTIGFLPWAMRGRVDEIGIASMVATSMVALPFLVALGWLYEALLTSSQWQATLGKKALGLKVTDEMGNRISFARATGRHFAKIISLMTCFIGFIMAAFTDRKRALHDMIAGTLVIRG